MSAKFTCQMQYDWNSDLRVEAPARFMVRKHDQLTIYSELLFRCYRLLGYARNCPPSIKPECSLQCSKIRLSGYEEIIPRSEILLVVSTVIWSIAKELKITPILDKLLEYKRSWIQHVNRMPRNRLPRVMKHYSPTGRKNHGRPLKILLDMWERKGSKSGPTPWKIWWWWWKFEQWCLMAWLISTDQLTVFFFTAFQRIYVLWR